MFDPTKFNPENLEKFNPADVAAWLAEGGDYGCTDEEFVETMVMFYKIIKENMQPDEGLSANDIRTFDIDKFTNLMSDIMHEIIESEDIDSSAWWKPQEESKDVEWNGRVYVNEKCITPEQYKMFFDRNEYGISFSVANSILKNNEEGNMTEVVPADELTKDTHEVIKAQIMSGDFSGAVTIEGQTINWKWTPEITVNGEDTPFANLAPSSRMKILSDMLDNECHSGSFEEI